MVFFALIVLKQGGTVYANFHIKHQNAHYLTFAQFVQLLKKGRASPNSWVLIDEMQVWLDSRVSHSKANRFGTYFLFQSAKLGYNIIYSSQVNMRVDIDYRSLTDIRFVAERENGGFTYSLMDNKFPDCNVPTGDSFFLPMSLASHFWWVYDTFEAVQPVGLESLIEELSR